MLNINDFIRDLYAPYHYPLPFPPPPIPVEQTTSYLLIIRVNVSTFEPIKCTYIYLELYLSIFWQRSTAQPSTLRRHHNHGPHESEKRVHVVDCCVSVPWIFNSSGDSCVYGVFVFLCCCCWQGLRWIVLLLLSFGLSKFNSIFEIVYVCMKINFSRLIGFFCFAGRGVGGFENANVVPWFA